MSHLAVPCQAFRYDLRGPKAGQYELSADLPGYPDTVRRDGRNDCWVALDQEEPRLNATGPVKSSPWSATDVEVEEWTAAKGVTLSEVTERSVKPWLGSIQLDYVGIVA